MSEDLEWLELKVLLPFFETLSLLSHTDCVAVISFKISSLLSLFENYELFYLPFSLISRREGGKYYKPCIRKIHMH